MVTEGIVDLLEAIEVKKEDSETGFLAAGALDFLAKAVFQQDAVGQAGEAVVEGEELELVIRFGE
jgi:hypothetical protein